MSKEFSLKEAAKQLNVHEDTLKRWETKGLLPFVIKRTPGGHRRITSEQIDELKQALREGLLTSTSAPVPAMEDALKTLGDSFLHARHFAHSYLQQNMSEIGAQNKLYFAHTERVLALMLYAAAVMEEPPSRLVKWVLDLSSSTQAELNAILNWKQRHDLLVIWNSFLNQNIHFKDHIRAMLEIAMQPLEAAYFNSSADTY